MLHPQQVMTCLDSSAFASAWECEAQQHAELVHVQGATGPTSATCQKDFNLHTCAGSCICGLPPPPPAPPIAPAPGCGYNTGLFSQQQQPATGCTCCDAGFPFNNSCATQVSSQPAKACIADHLDSAAPVF